MLLGTRRDPRIGPFAYFTIFLAIGLVVAYLNRNHIEQQTNFLSEYVRMADHYKGVASRDLLTYPTWGYPFVLLLLPRYNLVVLPQVVLGALASSWLFHRLRDETINHHFALTILFVGAIPWYLLHSVKWPQSFAASFVVLGIVVLDRAIRSSGDVLAIAAGVLFGLSLYFRSEFLYLPLFITLVTLLSRYVPRLGRIPIRPVLICAATAWLVLIPWALHYYRQTGRVSLTASQRGIVAFISLGQLPNNPWGAVYQDEYAYDYLKQAGISLAPQSDSGDRVLFDEYKRRVRAHPGAFAEKVAWNAVTTLAGGFYSGEIPLSSAESAQVSELRANLTSAVLGRRLGKPESSPERRYPAAYGAFSWWLFAKAVGSLLIVASMVGLVLTIVRGFSSPLVLLLGAVISYQYLLLMALATEPRYMNGLFLAMVPFIVTAFVAFRRLVARVRTRSPAASLASAPTES